MSIECFLITEWENDHMVLVWEVGGGSTHRGRAELGRFQPARKRRLIFLATLYLQCVE